MGDKNKNKTYSIVDIQFYNPKQVSKERLQVYSFSLVQMQEQEGLHTLRKLNNNTTVDIEHDLSGETHFNTLKNDANKLLSGKLPVQKQVKDSCGHDHGGKSHKHGHDHDHSHDKHGHEHKKKKHSHDGKQKKNYCIMFYTIFTCFSCLYLQTQHLNPFRGDHISKILSYLAWFDVIMCLWSYIQTYRIRNTVPKLSKMLNVQTVENKIVDPKYLLTARHCEKCNYYKLPRVSHCSTCGECVYKLDHHCMWTQTCIGHCNQRPFILFCFYMTIGVIQFWISTVRAFSMMTDSCDSQFFSVFEPGVYILWAITCFSAGVVGLMIVGLAISHSLMVCTNYTTLDSIKKKMNGPLPVCECRPLYHSNEHINTFDRGEIQNLRSLFGGNILTFWLPFGRAIENEFIIQAMNPQPTKLQLMRYTTLYDEQKRLQTEIQKVVPQVKQLYKGRKFVLDGQQFTV